MKTYSIEHPDKGLIRYSDSKRYWWLLSLLLPLTPVFVIGWYYQTSETWVLLTPLLVNYLIVPLADAMFKSNKVNPPEEIVPQLDADPYYRWLTYAAIPLHYLTLLVSLWFIAHESLSVGLYLAFAVIVGQTSGLAINTAHEIGHKNTKTARLLSRIALAVTGYGHFCIEHNMGHHRAVSTPEDPASAKMGESIYRFALREIPQAFVRGLQEERLRLAKFGKSFWSFDNHVLQSYSFTLLVQGGAVVVLGWQVLPFLLIHNAVAWFQLTSANYIEHYGLLRDKKDNGKYESCKPYHSWNSNHLVSNLTLFQLERHSDHHANASRPYQSLRAFDHLPELPSGYYAMYLAAYVPPIWYKLMDERLLSVPHINGDLSKVNIDPKHAARIKAKYANYQPRPEKFAIS